MRVRHRVTQNSRPMGDDPYVSQGPYAYRVQRRASPQRASVLPVILTVLVIAAVVGGLFVLFPMDWMRTPAVTASVDGAAFSPNQDGNLDTAIVLYSASEGATVSAYVLDDARTRVRTLVVDQATGSSIVPGALSGSMSQRSLVWDGRDDHGKVVMDGPYYVRITAKGTAREASNTVPVIVDTTPPMIRLANMPEDMQVKEAEILIEGVTEPEATVWLNNSPQPVLVDNSGGFRVEQRLQEGENRIELSVVDAAGNRSSITRQVTLVLKPPDIVIDNPPADLWINQKLLSVQGRVSPGTELTVNGKLATVDDEGQYNVDVLLQEGENLLSFQATDAVGNVSTAERQVYLKTRPPAVALTSIQEGMRVHEPSLLVVGQTEVGAAVRLNGRDLALDSRGGFQGLVNLVEGDNLIKAEVTDRAGNATTLARRVTYAPPTAVRAPADLGRLVPALLLGAGTILATWLLLGGWLSPIAISFAADRPALHPDPQGNVEPLLLSLDLSRAARITVDVWNDQDELVATLIYKRRRGAGEHILVWDGYDDEGMIASYGAYEIEATASTFTTSVSSSVRVQVEPSSPLLSARRQSVSRSSS
jgi:flagellar hook assembly protein FlgD